jgi:hypothetical protein
MIGIALVLWCWTLFLIFKETPLWILLRTFCRHKSTKNKNVIQVLEGSENPCSTN